MKSEDGFAEARGGEQKPAAKKAVRTAGALPDRATVEVRKAKRGERVYIDVLQNARGHHAVPPYVVRAVPGATVSTPLDWREGTDKLDPGAFTMKKAIGRFTRQKLDPLAGFMAVGGRRTRTRSTPG